MTDQSPDIEVREMALSEMGIRIDYFHESSDEHLELMGVDRALLPSRDAWWQFFEDDDARPIDKRQNYSLLWLADGNIVGFSSTDRIDFGTEAFMHLHITKPMNRRTGIGTRLLRRSAQLYFDTFRLGRLICEPNALNVGPNRACQSVGFRYQFSHFTTPGPLNYPQVTTRWILDHRPA